MNDVDNVSVNNHNNNGVIGIESPMSVNVVETALPYWSSSNTSTQFRDTRNSNIININNNTNTNSNTINTTTSSYNPTKLQFSLSNNQHITTSSSRRTTTGRRGNNDITDSDESCNTNSNVSNNVIYNSESIHEYGDVIVSTSSAEEDFLYDMGDEYRELRTANGFNNFLQDLDAATSYIDAFQPIKHEINDKQLQLQVDQLLA